MKNPSIEMSKCDECHERVVVDGTVPFTRVVLRNRGWWADPVADRDVCFRCLEKQARAIRSEGSD